ncbi:MAG: sugar ABC transporter permease [Clostridiales bacterium]|nr:sugar ABC transporter permease [Clostridiales bacterium]
MSSVKSTTIKRQRQISTLRAGENISLFLMTLPGVILFLCFAYLPMAGIVLAFKSFKPRLGIFGSTWVGLKNFEFMIRNATFWLTVRNTLFYNVIFLIIGILGPLAFALAVNEVRPKRVARVYQTLTIMPHFVSYVVVSVIVFAILSADSGIMGNYMKSQGLAPIVFYSEPGYWPWILSIVYLWKHIGYSSIIYLGTITGISDEFFEAAVIDGASKWQQIVHITLPFLKPMVVVLAIIRVGAMFSSNFDLFYQVPMNSGQLYPVTNTINVFTYNTLRNSNNVSLSAAVGFVQSVAGFLLVVGTNRVIRAIDPDLAMF